MGEDREGGAGKDPPSTSALGHGQGGSEGALQRDRGSQAGVGGRHGEG